MGRESLRVTPNLPSTKLYDGIGGAGVLIGLCPADSYSMDIRLGPKRMRKTRIKAVALLLVFGVTVATACAKKEPSTSKEERSDDYARLFGGLRLANGPIIAELYSDSATTTWGENTVRGLDNIATNWKRIMEGAKVEQIARVIAKTDKTLDGMVRDSGSIVFRIRDSAAAKVPRDTSMSFVTRWESGGSPRRWLIVTDSINP